MPCAFSIDRKYVFTRHWNRLTLIGCTRPWRSSLTISLRCCKKMWKQSCMNFHANKLITLANVSIDHQRCSAIILPPVYFSARLSAARETTAMSFVRRVVIALFWPSLSLLLCFLYTQFRDSNQTNPSLLWYYLVLNGGGQQTATK